MNKHHVIMLDPAKRLAFLESRLMELRERNDSVTLTLNETFVIRGRIEEVKLMIFKESQKDTPYTDDTTYE